MSLMKSNSSSRYSSMSVKDCSVKLRFFALVVNTANVINERTTPTLGISHALLAPVAIFTTYIFLIVLVTGSFRNQLASPFLQAYAITTCCALEGSLSILVFKELSKHGIPNRQTALVLDGVLPVIIALILIADLVINIFSDREEMELPSIQSSSTIDLHSHSGS